LKILNLYPLTISYNTYILSANPEKKSWLLATRFADQRRLARLAQLTGFCQEIFLPSFF